MKSLGETFGTQEGRESMLVGFLTGGLMGGGGAAVRGEYKNRKAAAANLKAAIDAGYFDNIMAAAQAENANASYIQQMQDALSRLINKERTVKVERKLESNTGLIFLIWLLVMGTPAFFVEHHTPWFLLYTFGSLILLMLVAAWWYNYIKKGEE